uniref:Uncharacterized protein n=1 Tax=Entomoneis paludosa TaxID=265537 RepID=A0A6U3F0B5_9STRA
MEWGYSSPPWHQKLQRDVHLLELAEQRKIAGGGAGAESSNNSTTIPNLERGFFTSKRSTDKCMSTAGTTIGFGSNSTARADFSVFLKVKTEPTKWHTTVMPCDHHGESNCLGLLSDRTHDKKKPDSALEASTSFSAFSRAVLLRSKTITAAETKGITQVFPKRPKPSPESVFASQEKMWNLLPSTYGIFPEQVRQFRADFDQNMDKILLDMLTICLPSNACSPKNKQALQDHLAAVGLRKKVAPVEPVAAQVDPGT